MKKKRNDYRTKRYAADPAYRERVLEYNRKYRAERKDAFSRNRRERVYGVDGEDMFREQGGMCGVCGVELLRTFRHRRAAHLDHNHRTGSVRGWLCSACNTGLGLFNDDPFLLQQAIRYLHAHD